MSKPKYATTKWVPFDKAVNKEIVSSYFNAIHNGGENPYKAIDNPCNQSEGINNAKYNQFNDGLRHRDKQC